MSDSTYNGWKNYETWVTNLWLSNEQSTYYAVNELLSEPRSVYEASEALSEFVEEMLPEVEGLAADLLGAAVSEIDWREIVENWVDDLDGFYIDDHEILEVVIHIGAKVDDSIVALCGNEDADKFGSFYESTCDECDAKHEENEGAE